MGRRSSGPLPVEADRLKAAVQSWRECRTKAGPMPTELWQCAMDLAGKHGVCRVARAIGVAYGSLRERMGSRESRAMGPTFLEFPAAMVLGGPGNGEAQVDIALSDGSQLRIRGHALDVAAIVAAFMGRS